MILINSFSGGRTSAYMTYMMINNLPEKYSSVINIFANTGQEHEKTLEFVNNCDREFGFNTVWIEAVVNPKKGKGSTHKIVSFETANRNGEPYMKAVEKYGIFNPAYPNCTSRTKLMPIYSYIRSLGLKKRDYEIAIGIRIDEYRRVNKNALEEQIIYPLIDILPSSKFDVLSWWGKQKFDLQLMEHQGNCTWCWKKSLKKHMMLIQESPQIYDFPKMLEDKYSLIGQNEENKFNRRKIFRGNLSTIELMKLSVNDDSVILDDSVSECGESCELFPMV